MEAGRLHNDAEFFEVQQALAGRYSLEAELGRGGMGIVYLARDVSLDRLVALKLLPPSLAADATFRQRIIAEARAAAKLAHPNIVSIYSVEEVDDLVYFAMQYVEGQTLAHRISEHGPLSASRAVRLLKEVSWALSMAHAQGVVHRDVKPGNILIEEASGRALVTDFGIAQVSGSDTATGFTGTAEFASPEQAMGEPTDPRSDIYSLGVVGFYALTGELPFKCESAADYLAAHIDKPPPLLRSVNSAVPRSLAAAIDRCLQKRPRKRFKSAHEFAEVIEQSETPSREVPIALRSFVKELRVATGTTGVYALIGVIYFFPVVEWLAQLGGPIGTALSVLLPAAFAGTPIALFVSKLRRLLKLGYRTDDIIHALEKDHRERGEELLYQYGSEHGAMEKLTGATTIGMFAMAGTLLLFGFGTGGIDLVPWAILPAGACLIAGLLNLYFVRRREDPVGARMLYYLKSKVGQGILKLIGFGKGTAAHSPAVTHRATEIQIGMAAEAIYRALPIEAQAQLGNLPDIIKRLERDASMLREARNSVGEALRETLRDGTNPDEILLHDRLTLEREKIDLRLRDAVGALETIRLGLLKLKGGMISVASMTTDLQKAWDLSEDVKLLEESHLELGELLGETPPDRDRELQNSVP